MARDAESKLRLNPASWTGAPITRTQSIKNTSQRLPPKAKMTTTGTSIAAREAGSRAGAPVPSTAGLMRLHTAIHHMQPRPSMPRMLEHFGIVVMIANASDCKRWTAAMLVSTTALSCIR